MNCFCFFFFWIYFTVHGAAHRQIIENKNYKVHRKYYWKRIVDVMVLLCEYINYVKLLITLQTASTLPPPKKMKFLKNVYDFTTRAAVMKCTCYTVVRFVCVMTKFTGHFVTTRKSWMVIYYYNNTIRCT